MSPLTINVIIFYIQFSNIFAYFGDDFDTYFYGDIPEYDDGTANETETGTGTGTAIETEPEVKERPTNLQENEEDIANDPAKMDCYCQGALGMIEKVDLFKPRFWGKNIVYETQENFDRFAEAMQNKLKEISDELCTEKSKSALEEFIKFFLDMATVFQYTMIEKYLRFEKVRRDMYKFYNEIFTSKALILKCTYDVEW